MDPNGETPEELSMSKYTTIVTKDLLMLKNI